jgi:hypothetical protein
VHMEELRCRGGVVLRAARRSTRHQDIAQRRLQLGEADQLVLRNRHVLEGVPAADRVQFGAASRGL